MVGLDLLWLGVIAKPLYQQGIGCACQQCLADYLLHGGHAAAYGRSRQPQLARDA